MLTVALVFISVALPVIGLPAGVLAPFPCVFYSVKFGRKAGYAIALIAASTLAVLDRSALLLYLLHGIAISLLLPELLLRGKGAYRAIVFSVALNGLLVLLYLIVLGQLQSVDIDGQLRSITHAAMKQVGDAYRQSGITGSDLQGIEAVLAQAEDLLIMIYPAVILMTLGICAGCNLLLLKRVAAFTGKELAFGRFSSFRNPDVLVWLLIVPGFALLADLALVDRVAMNLVAVVSFLYLIQGIAVVIWFFRKHSLPRFIMVFLFVMLLFQPMFAALIAAVGLIDLWADFRAPNKHKPVDQARKE